MTQVVWEATLDDRFQCEVRRTGDYSGELLMKDGELIVHRQTVVLSYAAMFGPDVGDVGEWEEICSNKADQLKGE